MNRRDFIRNTVLTASGSILFSGCSLNLAVEDVADDVISTYKFKDKSISMLGFGALRLPTLANGEVNSELNNKMVERAINAGINYYDTAYGYVNGKSERAMGDALRRYKRDTFYFATKMPVWLIQKEEDMHRIFNEQLKRCQTDHFDFYLAHSLHTSTWKNTKEQNIIPFLDKMKQEGKIKYLGFSHHGSPEMLQEIIEFYGKWDFVQLQLNKIDWKTTIGQKQYTIARKAELPIVVMEPLRGGALANLNEEALKILKDYNPDASAASWAFRWLAGLDGIMTMLSGMAKPEHLEDNIKTFKNLKPLSEEENEIYDKAINTYLKSNNIGCTSCKYCECPIGVNIPGIFSIYNLYKGIGFLGHYESLSVSERADKCIKCGLCKTKCPQQLDIPALLAKVDKEYKSLKGA